MKIKGILLGCLTLVFAAQLNAQCDNTPKAKTVSYTGPGTIVEVAASVDDFSTLVAAVKAADLVGTLSSEGPFTVFAPTNAAFEKLPDGTLATLLKAENKGQLQQILTYHVIPSKLMAADVLSAIEKNGGTVTVETASGGKLSAMVKDGGVVLKDENGNMAKVVNTDVAASNGVIHVIDTVVLPK